MRGDRKFKRRSWSDNGSYVHSDLPSLRLGDYQTPPNPARQGRRSAGLKGRFREEGYDEHKGLGTYKMSTPGEGGALLEADVPLRNAMNEVLRDEYVKDCQRACDRWNKSIAKAGLTGVTVKLPNRRFHRGVGPFANYACMPDGKPITPAEYAARQGEWLPTVEDFAYVRSLMHPVYENGKMAGWIAPPAKGIDGLPLDYAYVREPNA
jgi:benzoyl-CoA 2,3-dioxygenase component B